MTGFEVVVRPVVFPDIRPRSPRVLAPANNSEQGLVTLTGGGAKWVTTSYSWTVSVSQQQPHQEIKRQYNVERVYQMDDDGNINKENFVDVERLRKLRLKTTDDDLKVIYRDPPPKDNVEVKYKNKVRTYKTSEDESISGAGGEPLEP